MKLNCKVGDIAIRIKANPNSLIPVGHIIEVIAWQGKTALKDGNSYSRIEEDVWRVKYRDSLISPRGYFWGISDSQLRPLRPDEGQDETLSWKDVPTDLEVTKVNQYETTQA